MKTLTYPFTEDAVRTLKAGDAVSISGRLYTGRDKFHKFFADGGKLPVDFRDGALYHCGPVCVREGGKVEKLKSGKVDGGKVDGGDWKVVAAGPTTSVRENPYEPKFIAASGVRLVIGKGGMDAATLVAMKKHGCVYIQAVGGAGALYAAAVKRVAGVSLLGEFGAAEAVWHFDVEDFRGIVAMDSHGRSLFEEVERLSTARLRGLTPPNPRGKVTGALPPSPQAATASPRAETLNSRAGARGGNPSLHAGVRGCNPRNLA